MPDHVRRYGWIEYIELRRTPDGTVCFIGSGGWDELDDVAPHLPGDLARVEIEAPKKKVDAAGIQKALSRAGVRAELVLGEPVKRSGLATGLAP